MEEILGDQSSEEDKKNGENIDQKIEAEDKDAEENIEKDENKDEDLEEDYNPNILQEFREDFSLLIECGFIAAKQLDEINSTRLFNAAQEINPESSAPQVGLGHIALSKMEIKEATKIFETTVEKDPENHLAQCFLGFCLLLSKDKQKKGEKLIRETLEKTDDITIKNLGNAILQWAAKDAPNKVKSPFDL